MVRLEQGSNQMSRAKNELINILLLFGGGGTEHEISRISSQYLVDQINLLPEKLETNIQIHLVEILSNGNWQYQSKEPRSICFLNAKNELEIEGLKVAPIKIHFAVPCFHGPPGETGEIPAYLTIQGLPYLGSPFEGHMLCFNKIQTKLMLESQGIPTTPYIFTDKQDQKTIELIEKEFDRYGAVYIKSSHQGSSVGCHYVSDKKAIKEALEDALKHSPYALIEKPIKARELEVAVYEIDGELKVSSPGEIICEAGFYDYNEKYSEESKTVTKDLAEVSEKISEKIKQLSIEAFKLFKLTDLARIDFFLDGSQVYINEINTFPGMTPISMFPKMVARNGDQFTEIIKSKLTKSVLK